MNFGQFLHDRIEQGGFTTEDALTSFLPLVRQVVDAHQQGLVAPLEGIEHLQVEGIHVWFEQGRLAKPRANAQKVRDLSQPRSRAIEVVGEARVTDDVNDGRETVTDLRIAERGDEFKHPVYLPGYVSWEHEIGHHDPLTDIFCLGMILASLGCGLDFRDADDLATFVRQRTNLFGLNSHLHPVLARAIARMTELDRHKRPQDLLTLLHSLENYRDQNVDLDFELSRSGAFRQSDRKSREELILATLRQRLFEISHRNRLLHFRPTLQTVNLTLGSVPLAFAIESIRPEQILTWNRALQAQFVSGEAISLNTHLRFEEAQYLPGTLERIAAEARREQAEFGFAQLRLAICFLRWSNLKAAPVERFESPLVLLPVRLTKKKGVRDTWLLEATANEAEINPVLRHYLKQLYDLDLPETLDLSSATMDEFYEFLASKIRISEPAIEVAKIDRPRVQMMHALARRRLDQYQRRVRLSGRGVRSFQDLDYCYQAENFQPLGLALFRARIKAPETNLATLIDERPRPRSFISPPADGPVVEKERRLYALVEDEGTNPYHWEFDLCNVTLGSFRYRKLSLVRDYTALLDDKPENPAFDAIFSREPRPVVVPPQAAVREHVGQVGALAERNLLSLLESASPASKRLDGLHRKYQAARRELEAAVKAAAGWNHPVAPADADTALEQARAAVLQLESDACEEFGCEAPLREFLESTTSLRQAAEAWPAIVQDLHRHCLESPDGARLIVRLAELKPLCVQLDAAMGGVLHGFEEQPFADLRAAFGRISESLDGLPDFLCCLAVLEKLPAELAAAIRSLDLNLTQLEAASAESTLRGIFRSDRELDRFDGKVREEHVRRLETSISAWRTVNASVVCESVRRRFLENVRIASLPAAQLQPAQKEFKKQYQRGRRELEHEFGKSMRYRSIRELTSEEPGLVVRDLKPIWLMSPLSVSDTLPLDTGQFDVVIFDEASQITLEEAVPAVFRGLQTVVVGDRMQLPPTNFFSARRGDDEDALQVEEEAGQIVEYDLSSDSLLEHASRNLASTMLGWHYRSRSESLVNFSNAAFYQGKLLTIPEESLALRDRGEILVDAPAEGAANVAPLLDRPVSFHFLKNGVYQRRQNAAEAAYIAELVRALLSHRTGKSIGIIAFSEAQQAEIEDALGRLARQDAAFRALYEAELEREENDQFLGLLVKNLENIQGDERDIVLMSICYGYDHNRRMLMNFGPIDQCGGTAAARRVLESFTAGLNDDGGEQPGAGDAVGEQLTAALTTRGYQVDRQIGQSSLRCDLAVYRPGDETYRLGILIDTDAFYRHSDVLEQNLMRPRLLEEFGWKIAHVLTKDWHRNPHGVLNSLLQRVRGESANAGMEGDVADEPGAQKAADG